jgi:D-alanyl-D-alanine carboxypeptidase (penicillin-binding protein 5/6)
MDHRDEWFEPDHIEEQIKAYQQDADPLSLNAQLLRDLQLVADDNARRLAQIRERLIEHATENGAREPVPLQRYRDSTTASFRPEEHTRKKQSSLLVQLVSGIAAVLVIASMLLVFVHFKPHQEQGRIRSSSTATPTTFTTTVSIKGNAAFLMDTTTGKVLVDVNGQAHLPIGNMAQIMTAVVAIDNANMDQYITIEQTALNEVPPGGSKAHLLVGDQIQLRDLLYALLLPSGDDASLVIARAVGGSTQKFVAMMNDEAQQLHLNDTHFSSPYGSSVSDDYSSAADLAHLTSYAMQLFHFAQVVAVPKHALTATNSNHSYIWSTTNASLTVYTGMHSIKTGYATKSGACIVFSVQYKDHLLIGAEVGAPSENVLASDVKKFVSWGISG